MKYLLILLLFLVGCGHTPDREIKLVPTPVLVACDPYGHIAAIHPLPVVFVIGEDEQGNKVLGLRGDQYSNLSINSASTLLYIIEQNKAIDYYVKCISDHNTFIIEKADPE
jgi:hypothetical protein